MSGRFEQWWYLEDVDGVTPRLYIHSMLERVSSGFIKNRFSFALSLPAIELRITKYFSLLHTIVNANQRKEIQGPNVHIVAPQDWSERDESEWLNAYMHYFDTIFWERVFGPEKAWEERFIQWRYALPGILEKYTVRSRDNLPHVEEEINSDGEYDYVDAD
jgi:hypothetical protein